MIPTEPPPLRQLQAALATALETHPDEVADEAAALLAALGRLGYTITLARPVRSPSLASIVQGRTICSDCGEWWPCQFATAGSLVNSHQRRSRPGDPA